MGARPARVVGMSALEGFSRAKTSFFQRRGVPVLLGLAFACFAVGIFFPFFHVQKFWIFENAVSAVSGILILFQEGEYFLFGVLTLFTLVFPAVKLGLLTLIWAERDHDLKKVSRLLDRVGQLGKWSMLDVFVVAVLIVVMRSAGVAQIHVGMGIYFFTFSVIMTQTASNWISRLLTHRGSHAP